MVASCPSLHCSCRKSLPYAQKWLCARFGLQDIDCALTCDMWRPQTSEQLSRLRFSQQCVGSGAASLSATHVPKMWCTAERRFVRHACLRNPCLLRNLYKSPRPTRSLRSLRAAAHSLHYACILLAKDPIPLSKILDLCLNVEKRRFGHGVVVSKVCYGILEGVVLHLPCYCNKSRLSF